MKKVVVSGLKLRLFEQTFKKVNDKERLFAYLESLLEATRGRESYSFLVPKKVVHENPVDEVACAEQIAFDIRLLDLGNAVNDGARKVLDECVKEWFESVKQRNLSSANEGAQDEASTPDYPGILAIFSNKKVGERFVDNLKKETARAGTNGLSLGRLAAATHQRHELNNIHPKWGEWESFWGEVKRCLNIPSARYAYRRQYLLNLLKKPRN